MNRATLLPAPPLTNTNSPTAALTYKLFAAPGIDSGVDEQGLFASGAGLAPDHVTSKAAPTDWGNESPVQDHATGRLVGNYAETQAKPANAMSIRRRGLAPFGGFFAGARAQKSHQHPGGIVDHNAGADSLIAGGPGAASSMCRVNAINKKPNVGMKLPILPQSVVRGGAGTMPSGGGSHEPLTAPLQTKVSGWQSIFSFRNTNGAAK